MTGTKKSLDFLRVACIATGIIAGMLFVQLVLGLGGAIGGGLGGGLGAVLGFGIYALISAIKNK